jgi:predicted dehydrogenase
MTAGTLGWGILGCGNFVRRRIVPAFQASSNARLVALQRRSLDEARATARELGVARAYSSRDELLADPEVQAIFVGSHPAGHIEDVLAAAAARKPVLCEKPLARSAAECRRMVQACAAAGVKLFVGHCGRYKQAVELAREMLAGGKLGRLEGLNAWYGFRTVPGAWRRDARLAGGGPLLDVGPHVLDLVRYVSRDEAAEVSAIVEPQRDMESGRCEERARAILRLRSGAPAYVQVSFREPLRTGFEVLGSEAHLRGDYILSNLEGPIVKLERFAGDPAPMQAETIPIERREIYRLQIEDVTRALSDPSHAPRCATGEDGLRTLAIIDAIYESSRTGRRTWVQV